MPVTWHLARKNNPVQNAEVKTDLQFGVRSFPCRHVFFIFFTAFFLATFWPNSGWAQLDLQKVQHEILPNGLTLLLLEEHTFPSASVQMLYRVGGRSEPAGQSGIAHFLEHMAFRASANFPDTDVVSRIYAAGGEWHGYTWIDQTTYFSTVPGDQVELLLRIEADRMQRLLIEPRWIEPEKGAVLAEMHGYENDPASVLHDAVVFAAFQAHPYRNNVIGWETDILALQQQDVLAFYRQHYVPANAVLAVVGDIDTEQVRQMVVQLFGDFPAKTATPLPHTLEPPQMGVRRIELLGIGDANHAADYFELAYPAPAASEPDFAAMLVLQQWLSGGSGVNFMQEYGTTAAQPGTALYGKLDGLSTWFPPSAQRYLFSIRGTLAPGQSEQTVQERVNDAFQQVREGQISDAVLQRSKQRVLEELVYDLGSHEEAAHQLAFFEGLNALDQWLALPQTVAQISNEDLIDLANRRLQPWQQTGGWYRADEMPAVTEVVSAATSTVAPPRAAEPRELPELTRSDSSSPRSRQSSSGKLPAPQQFVMAEGLPMLVQSNPASAAAFVSLIVDGNQWQGSAYLKSNDPQWGVSSLSTQCLPDQVSESLATLLAEVDKLVPDPQAALQSMDPATRLNEVFESMLGIQSTPEKAAEIRLAVLTGKLEAPEIARAKARLKGLRAAPMVPHQPVQNPADDRRLNWPYPLAQAQLGYVVKAPLATSADYLAWRALQYILAHDYEGRLGKRAISNSGLAYYIDSQYRSDGQRAWISLSAGVDPDKSAALELLFREQIADLELHPPSTEEVAEARDHLLGRLATQRQSNVELAAGLTEQWLWYGRLLSHGEQIEKIKGLKRQQVLSAIPAFSRGAFAVIRFGKDDGNVTD